MVGKRDILLRGAQPEDVATIVRVLMGAFSYKFAAIFGRKMNEGARALVDHYALQENLVGVFVIEVDRNIAGVIELSTKEMEKGVPPSLQPPFTRLGALHVLRAALPFLGPV
jgi:hypothetical protein